MPPDMILLFLSCIAITTAQKFKAGRGYCIKFDEQEYDMKVRYYKRDGSELRGSAKVLENYTAKLSCSGGRVIEPEQLTCQCFNVKYRNQNTRLCVFKYQVGNRMVGFLRNRGYCVHKSCAPIYNPILKGSYSCDTFLQTQDRGESRYAVGTKCSVQCDANHATSTKAAYAKCECKSDNQAGRTTRSSCEFEYYGENDRVLRNSRFECKDTTCEPMMIDNGYLEPGCIGDNGLVAENARCKYQCNPGYTTKQDVTAFCACETGQKCELQHIGMFTFETKTKLCVSDEKFQPECGSIDFLLKENQELKCSSQVYTADAECNIVCKNGFQAVTDSEKISAKCHCNGEICNWQGFTDNLACEASNPCSNQPCGEGGICLRNPHIPTKYQCECKPGFVYRLNRCEPAVCENLFDRMELENISLIECADSKEQKSARYELDPNQKSVMPGTICWPRCKSGMQQFKTDNTKKQYQCRCMSDGKCRWSGTHPDRGLLEDYNCV